MHSTYGPACNIQTYVDDVPQIHTGDAVTITEQAVEQAVKLVQLLADDGYKVSEKSTLVASDPEIGKTIRNRLRHKGIEVQLEASGRDLGVDFVAGRRRRVKLQSQRLRNVQRGTGVVKHMLKTTREARRLVFTGIKPRAWGLSALGCSPTMAKTLRGSIIKGLGIRKAGGCATMALATHGYSQRDPWITFSIENITHFLEAWINAQAHISMRIRAILGRDSG